MWQSLIEPESYVGSTKQSHQLLQTQISSTCTTLFKVKFTFQMCGAQERHWSGPFPFKTHNLLRAFQRSADVHGFSKIQTVLEYHCARDSNSVKDISAIKSSDFANGEYLFCRLIGDEWGWGGYSYASKLIRTSG